jgi:hypothetical protein
MNHHIYLEKSGILETSDDHFMIFTENESETESKDFPIFGEENPFFQFYLDEKENDSIALKISEEKKEKSIPKFIIQKDSNSLINKKRKRGRQKSEEASKKEKNKRIHDKNCSDNVLRKLQNHYISFILSFLNCILTNLKYEENKRFLKLDYNFKKKIKKENVKSLKNKTIGDIISNKISRKYKYEREDFNKQLCDEIKLNDSVLRDILSENYLLFFKKIYYKSINKISFGEYGLNKEIILPKKVKMYKDLLKDNEDKDSYNFDSKKINKCVARNFIPELAFSLNQKS